MGISRSRFRYVSLPKVFASQMVDTELNPVKKAQMLVQAIGIAVQYFAVIVFVDYHAYGWFDETVFVGE
jgi:hypothetical protein